jgi:hypothetical protein
MIRLTAIASTAVIAATVAAAATGIAGCATKITGTTATTSTGAQAASSTIPVPMPPTINEGTQVSGAVSQLRPAGPIMVGDNPTTVCLAGFYIDLPNPGLPGHQQRAFLTAAQCTQSNDHAPVAVMKAQAPGQNPVRTQIGQITYLSPGDQHPAVADAPWTIPTASLAVYKPSELDWPLPVEVTVNNQAPTSQVLQTAQSAEQHTAHATWTNSFAAVVSGHVLDPVSTPELRSIPNTLQRVVIAADDASQPIYPQVLGSPVTVDLDGTISNLGIITGTDAARHWVVVDLIGTFLAAQGARLATTH